MLFAPTTVGVLTLTGGRKMQKPAGRTGTRHSGASAPRCNSSFSSNLGTFFTAGFQRGDYSQFNTSYGIERQDELSDAALGLVWSFRRTAGRCVR